MSYVRFAGRVMTKELYAINETTCIIKNAWLICTWKETQYHGFVQYARKAC